jgi:hypothetical protein
MHPVTALAKIFHGGRTIAVADVENAAVLPIVVVGRGGEIRPPSVADDSNSDHGG